MLPPTPGGGVGGGEHLELGGSLPAAGAEIFEGFWLFLRAKRSFWGPGRRRRPENFEGAPPHFEGAPPHFGGEWGGVGCDFFEFENLKCSPPERGGAWKVLPPTLGGSGGDFKTHSRIHLKTTNLDGC